jgi:two-component system LytT family sensor kinase
MASSPFSYSRFRNIFLISWLVVIADQVLLLRWFGFSWGIAITDTLINDILLLLACVLVIHMFRYYLPQREKYINLLFWNIFLTGVVILLTRWILKSVFSKDENYLAFLDQSLIIRSSLDVLLLGCVMLISVIWYNWQEQQELDARNRDTERMAKEAELFKLRQQLQPHFLFNSLNSINALIGSRPEEARKMVQQLSDFLRGTIKKEEHQWVTLKEELQYLQLYLDIEKVRFGHRLSTHIEVDEETESLKLPSLLLQPIVENAIKFGLYDTTGETVIQLSATTEENNLTIKVTNPFDSETASPKQGTGFGLQSIQRRLYLLFARNDLLKTETKENTFITSVKIPQVSEVPAPAGASDT